MTATKPPYAPPVHPAIGRCLIKPGCPLDAAGWRWMPKSSHEAGPDWVMACEECMCGPGCTYTHRRTNEEIAPCPQTK